MRRVLIITALILCIPSSTDAGVEDRMLLVRMLLGEAGWRPANDHPAMLHVLDRRLTLPAHEGFTLTRMAQAYSKFLSPRRDQKLPHRASINALTVDTVPGWAIRLVDQFLEDPTQVKDPCRGRAWNWGAAWEITVSKKRRVNCGYTRNVFLKQRRHIISTARR